MPVLPAEIERGSDQASTHEERAHGTATVVVEPPRSESSAHGWFHEPPSDGVCAPEKETWKGAGVELGMQSLHGVDATRNLAIGGSKVLTIGAGHW